MVGIRSEHRRVVAIVVSDVSSAFAIEALADPVLMESFDLHFFLLCPEQPVLEERLVNRGARAYFLKHRGWGSIVPNTVALARKFSELQPDVVHTHLLHANLAGLAAGLMTGVKKRIHTRHHADPYHHHHRRARIYDWIAQRLSTQVVATCQNGAEVLRNMEGLPERKLVKLAFGVDVAAYENVEPERVQRLREKYQLPVAGPVIGVVSRALEIKGYQFLIPAFRRLLETRPEATLLLAGSTAGAYRASLASMIAELPERSVREVGFELDMPALYATMDIFIHVPISRRGEAFGQTYLEALAAARPCVFTMSGVAPELVRHRENALVVPFCDSDAILDAMKTLLQDPVLGRELGKNGREKVRSEFGAAAYVDSHMSLWAS